MHTHILRDRKNGVIYLDQRQYLLDLLKRENMVDCRPVGLPMNPGTKLKKATKEEEENVTTQDREWFRRVVGSTLWMCTQTRPDITAAVRWLCQYVSQPTQSHKDALITLLRYLKGTQQYGISFRKTGKGVHLLLYTDATWGSDLDDRRGISSYVMEYDGGILDWKARKQPYVTGSAMESELCSGSEGQREGAVMRTLLNEVGEPQGCIPLLTDSQSMIMASKNDGYHPSLRHVDIRHKQLFDAVREGVVKLQWVSSADQLADMLTKPLQPMSFKKHAAQLITKVPET